MLNFTRSLSLSASRMAFTLTNLFGGDISDPFGLEEMRSTEAVEELDCDDFRGQGFHPK